MIKKPLHRGLNLSWNLINLSLSPSNSIALCFIASGACSADSIRTSGEGGTIRSLGIAGQAVGGIDEVEQPAISNALSGIRIFDAITVYHLFLDHFNGAYLRFLLLLFCKL